MAASSQRTGPTRNAPVVLAAGSWLAIFGTVVVVTPPGSDRTAADPPTAGTARERLVRATSPRDRINPVPSGRYDVVVLGAGAAGLVASGILGASQARVALIEANALGGDCTHVGCVP
ncbi:MAG: hypothetical protein R2789_19485, partial [Microthrixaceae bacterium]